MYLSFMKETGCLSLHVGSHLTVQFHLIRVTTGMAVKHRTLSPDLFSHAMVQYVLGLSLHSSEMAGKHAVANL